MVDHIYSAFIAMFLLALPASSWAATVLEAGDWQLKKASAPTLDWSEAQGEVYGAKKWMGEKQSEVTYGSAITVTSSWSDFIDCDMDSAGVVIATFTGHPGNWPTASEWSSNSTFRCTLKKTFLLVTQTIHLEADIVAAPAGWPVTSQRTEITLSGGISVKGPAEFSPNQPLHFVYELPADVYTSGIYQAKKSNGSNWTGVKCKVQEGSTSSTPNAKDAIAFQMTEAASVCASGCYCPITVDGSTEDVPVVFDTVAVATTCDQ